MTKYFFILYYRDTFISQWKINHNCLDIMDLYDKSGASSVIREALEHGQSIEQIRGVCHFYLTQFYKNRKNRLKCRASDHNLALASVCAFMKLRGDDPNINYFSLKIKPRNKNAKFDDSQSKNKKPKNKRVK